MDELDIVVVGAGIGGLGAALALARTGHRVTLVERDDTPMPPDPEAAFEWDRRGAPQVQHPHVFLGLARTILRDRFPDVLQAMTDLGIEPPVIGQGGNGSQMDEETIKVLAADDDLRMLPVRRTTFEWVMRTMVLAEANVDFRVGVGVGAVELKEVVDGPPVVTGVRLEDDTAIDTDLVVATTGRRGDVPAWLGAHGIEIDETISGAGVVYFSRFYRAEEEYGFGFRAGFGAGLGVGCIGSDARTYSITAFVDKNDKELRAHLSDNARFEATIALLPEIADVVAAGGTPMNDVHCMTGLINRTRVFTDASGAPLVAGLVAIGDAHTCTNPAYGRGMSLALKQAVMLADALASHDDVLSAARAYEQRSVDEVVPWYEFSVMTDQMRSAAVKAGADPSTGAGDPLRSLFESGGADPEVIRLVMRVMNLLELPSTLMERLPELQARAAAAPKVERPVQPLVKRPKRAELLAAGT
jgi:2-polyprenyl-6-methoxyphenol hydroxylase-like FAD-dependent oxidoreductase